MIGLGMGQTKRVVTLDPLMPTIQVTSPSPPSLPPLRTLGARTQLSNIGESTLINDYLQSKQKVKIIGDPVNFLLEGKEAFSKFPTKEDLLIGDADLIVNPCPNHPPLKNRPDNREANWLCLTEHQAICDECFEKHKKKFKKHTIMDLRTCINESRSVLCNLET